MKKDYEELIRLIKKAQGTKTLNQFALGAGINAGHLSRILNGNFKNPPSPETLKKIAKNSHGEVSYEELLRASKYIDDIPDKEKDSIYDIDLDKYNKLIENKRISLLFDKLGELDDEELNQVADIVDIVTKIDKTKDKK